MKFSFIFLVLALKLMPLAARAAIEKQRLSKGLEAFVHQRQLHHVKFDRKLFASETPDDAQTSSDRTIAVREAGEVKLHLHRRRRAGREGVKQATGGSIHAPVVSRPGTSEPLLEKEAGQPQNERWSEGSLDSATRRDRGERNVGSNLKTSSAKPAGQGSQLVRLDTSRGEDPPHLHAANSDTEPQKAAEAEDGALLSRAPWGIDLERKSSADDQGTSEMLLRNERSGERGEEENLGGDAKSADATPFSASLDIEGSESASHEVSDEDANDAQPADKRGDAAKMASKDSGSRRRKDEEKALVDVEQSATPEDPRESADSVDQQLKQDQVPQRPNHDEKESQRATALNQRKGGFRLADGFSGQQDGEGIPSQGDRQHGNDEQSGKAREINEAEARATVDQQYSGKDRHDISVDNPTKDRTKDDEATNNLQKPAMGEQTGSESGANKEGKDGTAGNNSNEGQSQAASTKPGHESDGAPEQKVPEKADAANPEEPAAQVKPKINPFLSLLDAYRIESCLDVPCGDAEEVANKVRFFPLDRFKDIRYIGVDAKDSIIDSAVRMQGSVPTWNFHTLNYLRDDLPTADLLISRAALLRLPLLQLVDLLENCARSGARYLLLGSYTYFDMVVSTEDDSWPRGDKNYPAQDKGIAYSVNLQQAPFNLDEPLQKIPEPEGFGAKNIDGKPIQSSDDDDENASAGPSIAVRQLLLFSGDALRKKDFSAMRSRVTAFIAVA